MLHDFSRGVLSGQFKDADVLLGAIQVMVAKHTREARGKKLTNMHYPEAFDNVCTVLATVSPRAYRLFRAFFGGRDQRSMRHRAADSGRFEPGFSADNAAAAARIIESYDYTGPVVLACDDTKLEPVLREVQLNSGAWVIVGHAGDPIFVTDEDELDSLLTDSSVALADKVCICHSDNLSDFGHSFAYGY